MSIWLSIILGAVQGVTEFLPISSSGHLLIAEAWLGVETEGFFFDVVLHVGTLLAVFVYYWDDVRALLGGFTGTVRGLFRGELASSVRENESVNLFVLLVIAMIPTGVVAMSIRTGFEVWQTWQGYSLRNTTLVGGLLLLNGAVLTVPRITGAADSKLTEMDEDGFTLWGISVWASLGIGFAQGLAVLPGFSRAGLTIATALVLGVWRREAARFSFLLSIPAIIAALAVEGGTAYGTADVSHSVGSFVGGSVAAGVVGYGAIALLIDSLEGDWFHHFAWYCWAAGATCLLV